MSRSMATVSVVIPTRNRLGLLAQTLHTVLAQRDVDLEVVVVDEASDDGTADWLAAHRDPRVGTVRHDEPRGLSNARNAGIAASQGHWLGFVDDDDLWLPTKLTEQLDAAERTAAAWSYGGELIFSDGPRLRYVTLARPEEATAIPWRNTVPGGGSNAIVAREAIEAVGGFDPTVDIAADWDLWIRLSRLGPPAVLEHPLMAYRIHGGNMSGNTREMLEAFRLLDMRYRAVRDGEPLDWDNAYRWFWLRTMASGDRVMARRMATLALRAGHPGATRRLARAAVPVPLRQPVNEPGEATTLRDRVRPRRVLPWPPGSEAWLREVLSIAP